MPSALGLRILRVLCFLRWRAPVQSRTAATTALEKRARRGTGASTHPLSANRVPIITHTRSREGSAHTIEPDEPVCPNVAGEVRAPLLWGAFRPLTSQPSPQLAARHRATPDVS